MFHPLALDNWGYMYMKKEEYGAINILLPELKQAM